jgi:FlaA1/EpsC-like NDP-sugar epimerase
MEPTERSINISDFIKRYLNRLPATLIINLLVGLIIALFLGNVVAVNFITLCAFSISVASGISLTVSFVCSVISYYLKLRSLHTALFLNLLVATCVTILDLFFINWLSNFISSEIQSLAQIRFLLIPSLFLSLAMTAAHILYEYRQQHIPQDTGSIIPEKSTTGILFLRDENGHVRIDVNRVLYLTANKDKTVLHCEDTQYVLPELLGNVLKKLPSDFFRIHKSYAVRLSHIHRMEYYSGGRYMVFLDDEEQTSLICARSYSRTLKEKVGISK